MPKIRNSHWVVTRYDTDIDGRELVIIFDGTHHTLYRRQPKVIHAWSSSTDRWA